MKTNKTLISMVEDAIGTKLVPAKSKKSDKGIVIRVGASRPSIKVVNKKN